MSFKSDSGDNFCYSLQQYQVEVSYDDYTFLFLFVVNMQGMFIETALRTNLQNSQL